MSRNLGDNKEPTGTYTDGYDAGLRDAANGEPQKFRAPRTSRGSTYRFGYADGYWDGRDRAAPTAPEADGTG